MEGRKAEIRHYGTWQRRGHDRNWLNDGREEDYWTQGGSSMQLKEKGKETRAKVKIIKLKYV